MIARQGITLDALTGYHTYPGTQPQPARLPGLDWAIVGGESGFGARPFDLRCARYLINGSRILGFPVFVKQLGARPLGNINDLAEPARASIMTGGDAGLVTLQPLKLADRMGGDPGEWPEDLRVQQFPPAAPRQARRIKP